MVLPLNLQLCQDKRKNWHRKELHHHAIALLLALAGSAVAG